MKLRNVLLGLAIVACVGLVSSCGNSLKVTTAPVAMADSGSVYFWSDPSNPMYIFVGDFEGKMHVPTAATGSVETPVVKKLPVGNYVVRFAPADPAEPEASGAVKPLVVERDKTIIVQP